MDRWLSLDKYELSLDEYGSLQYVARVNIDNFYKVFWLAAFAEEYSEPCQTSKMEHFAKTVNV